MDEFIDFRLERDEQELEKFLLTPGNEDYLSSHSVQEYINDKNSGLVPLSIKVRDYYRLKRTYRLKKLSELSIDEWYERVSANDDWMFRFSFNECKPDFLWNENSDLLPEDIIYTKDYMVGLCFGDNDFGSDFLSVGKIFGSNFCSLINFVLHNFTYESWEDYPDGREKFIKEFRKYLDKESILCYFRNLLNTSSLIRSWEEFEGIKFTYNNPEPIADYFTLDDPNKISIGTEEEVLNWVRNRNKNENEKNSPLSDIWLNGEYLFIQIKDGKLNVWIQ